MVKNVLKSVFKSITILSRPYFSLEENELKFKVDTDTFFKFPITNVETKTRYDSYILEAYTLSADNIYLEYIHTDIDVSWNGQALSFFVTLLKDSLKTRHIELLERFEFNHYEFLSYKINDDYILNIIYIYEVNKDVFILDKKSELYENLLKNFKKDYKYEFEKNRDTKLNINLSLAKNNAMNSYFGISN